MNDGTYIIPKITKDKGEKVDKSSNQYTSADWDKLTKNSRVKHILYYSLDAYELNRIFACDIVKQIWNKLIVAYERTNQVQEKKMKTYINHYELFKMQSKESIKDQFI